MNLLSPSPIAVKNDISRKGNLNALNEWQISPADVDFIASHGQTIYHAPKRLHKQAGYPNATLQIGDGDHLSVKTGIITVSDFRQALSNEYDALIYSRGNNPTLTILRKKLAAMDGGGRLQ